MQVTVIGQGYVGLPLAIAACRAGHQVVGLDTDVHKIDQLSKGISPIEDLLNSEVSDQIDSGKYLPSGDYSLIKRSEVVVICVPTPLLANKKPDLSALLNATSNVAKNLNKGALVIVESTVEPGTCRDLLQPVLIGNSDLTEADFDLAYSPERIDPTNKNWTIRNTPKLVAGSTENALNRAVNFYRDFIEEIISCDSIEVAEMAKLLENSFRFINISFINEISMLCNKIGVDIGKVISAAATKPYGFMPFYPSIGVGGHCIPVDPLYLANTFSDNGITSRFIDLADQINDEMPKYYAIRAKEMLGTLSKKKILVIGVAYKPNVSDVRETPALDLISELVKNGAFVFWHDDLVKTWNNEVSASLNGDYDLAVIATLHSYINLDDLGDTPILNTKG
jgi:UDP-N-acetyl-D-glucosamine dehydrogenase